MIPGVGIKRPGASLAYGHPVLGPWVCHVILYSVTFVYKMRRSITVSLNVKLLGSWGPPHATEIVGCGNGRMNAMLSRPKLAS